jgi:hypothetical protein
MGDFRERVSRRVDRSEIAKAAKTAKAAKSWG